MKKWMEAILCGVGCGVLCAVDYFLGELYAQNLLFFLAGFVVGSIVCLIAYMQD